MARCGSRRFVEAGALLGAFALAPLVAAAQLSSADMEAAQKLRDEARQSPLAYELVASLSTEVGPRFAGSPGDRAAVDWAVRHFKRLGFSNVSRMEVIVPRWVRGKAELHVVEPFPQTLPVVALGGSIGTPEQGVTAEVLEVSDVGALASVDPKQVSGRIVYFSQRMERTRDGSGYGRAAHTRFAGASAAAEKGAAAVVIRSISTSNNRLPHTGTVTYSISSPRIPAAAISNPDADMLERMLASGKPVKLSLKLTSRELPPTLSANVIAEIPGTDLANEIVLLGAHLDSWDLGTGALDDGAGVAIVMAAARLLRDVQPRIRRTVRVVLFANEEFGLSGAQTYAAKMHAELDRHAVAMEADLGAGPVWEIESRVWPESLPLVRQIHSVLEPLGIALGGNDSRSGADLTPLRSQGVPTFGLRLDATDYFDHHHTANDTLDKVNPEHLAQAVAAYATAAYLAARVPQAWTHLPAEAQAPTR